MGRSRYLHSCGYETGLFEHLSAVKRSAKSSAERVDDSVEAKAPIATDLQSTCQVLASREEARSSRLRTRKDAHRALRCARAQTQLLRTCKA